MGRGFYIQGMTTQQIVRMGAPVLSRRAEEIPDPASEEIAALAKDMADSMAAAGGVGLAARRRARWSFRS